MNPREIAAARRIDAFLAEVHGDGVPADLADRVQQRLRAVPAPRRAHRLAAAIVMLGGALAVVGVGVLRERGALAPGQGQESSKPPKTTQEKVATVSTADVRPTPDQTIDVPQKGEAAAAILDIAQRVGVPLVLAGGPTSDFVSDDQGLHWRAAIARLALGLKAGVGEYGPILTVVPGAKSLPYEVPLTLTANDVDVRAFAKALSARVGVALVVAGDVRGRVRCELDKVSWRDVLEFVAGQLGCVVEGRGTVLVLRRGPGVAAPAPRTAFHFVDMDCNRAFAAIASITGSNLVIAAVVQGTVTVQAGNVSGRAMAEAVAASIGAEVREEGRILHVDRSAAVPEMPADVTAEDVDLRTFAELVRSSTQVALDVPADAKEHLAVFASGAPLEDLLRAVALATGHKLVNGPGEKSGLRIE